MSFAVTASVRLFAPSSTVKDSSFRAKLSRSSSSAKAHHSPVAVFCSCHRQIGQFLQDQEAGCANLNKLPLPESVQRHELSREQLREDMGGGKGHTWRPIGIILTLEFRPSGSHQLTCSVPSSTSRSTLGIVIAGVSQNVRRLNSPSVENVRRILSPSAGETSTQR